MQYDTSVSLFRCSSMLKSAITFKIFADGCFDSGRIINEICKRSRNGG